MTGAVWLLPKKMTEDFFQTKLFKGIILAVLCLIILVFVFGTGVFVGMKKAEFSFKWADEYHRNFGGPQGGFFGDMINEGFTESNGVFGQIIKIDGQTLTIKGKDNVEKIVIVGEKTTILCLRKNIKLSDLKINDSLVAIGDPNNNGQIQAELIRVIPSPPKNGVNSPLQPIPSKS